MKFLIFPLMFLSGCSFEGKVSTEDLNKNFKCTNLKTNETFHYNSNTIKKIRIGVYGVSFVLVDSKGITRYINSEQEKHIECKEIK